MVNNTDYKCTFSLHKYMQVRPPEASYDVTMQLKLISMNSANTCPLLNAINIKLWAPTKLSR